MRIAYVCADPGIPVYGAKGASVHIQDVARAPARRPGGRAHVGPPAPRPLPRP